VRKRPTLGIDESERSRGEVRAGAIGTSVLA
jgi:hypothetical protein